MALYLPEKYRKEAMCEAHDSIFGGHNATQKTHQNFYFVLLTKDAPIHQKHKNFCVRCQLWKKSTHKKMPLLFPPIPKRPNFRIHADLFALMMMADNNKKFVLWFTYALTKYAVVTAIVNKDAETVADFI
jgi:hypothetical protein